MLNAERLRRLCLEAGADDVGFVAIGRPELDDQREDILRLYPWTKGLVSLVCRMNREPARSPARSVANLEFHHTGERTNEVASTIVAALETEGHRAVNPAMGFPMEIDRVPGKIWAVAHKPVAVAAGLGQMGIHRNVIHPKFGNFVLLSTVLVDAEISEEGSPLDYNPCLECKLCVAACPVGAIGADGHFDFSACYTHNYREFMGGFGDWVENVVESRDALDYRRRVSDSETASVWQSLGFGPNYKAAYCMAVCPAGEDVIGPFLDDRKGFLKAVVDPLQQKEETLFVVPGSDAEAHAAKKFPHKRTKPVGNGLRPGSIRSFLGEHASCLPAAPVRGTGGDLPLHIHGGGARRGDRRDPGQDDPGRGRARRLAGPERDGRQSDVGGLPAEGAEPRLGPLDADDSPQGVAATAGRIRQVLPVLNALTLAALTGGQYLVRREGTQDRS